MFLPTVCKKFLNGPQSPVWAETLPAPPHLPSPDPTSPHLLALPPAQLISSHFTPTYTLTPTSHLTLPPTSPHHLSSPHLPSPHLLTSAHLTPPHFTSSHLASLSLPSLRLHFPPPPALPYLTSTLTSPPPLLTLHLTSPSQPHLSHLTSLQLPPPHFLSQTLPSLPPLLVPPPTHSPPHLPSPPLISHLLLWPWVALIFILFEITVILSLVFCAVKCLLRPCPFSCFHFI